MTAATSSCGMKLTQGAGRALCTGTGPRLTPAIGAGKGWRGRRELAPRRSATRIQCMLIGVWRVWRHTCHITSSVPPPPPLPTTVTHREEPRRTLQRTIHTPATHQPYPRSEFQVFCNAHNVSNVQTVQIVKGVTLKTSQHGGVQLRTHFFSTSKVLKDYPDSLC